MTKSWEKGDNEFFDEAKREAARTGEKIWDILARMLREAKQERHVAKRMKIVQAEKYARSRNRDKRRKRK